MTSQASCGATSTVKAPSAVVDLGLAPRPGLSAEDAQRAARALATVRAQARACVMRALAADPSLESVTLVVKLRVAGRDRPTTISVSGKPLGQAAAQSCVEHFITQKLGDDVAPTSLDFPLRIRIDPS